MGEIIIPNNLGSLGSITPKNLVIFNSSDGSRWYSLALTISEFSRASLEKPARIVMEQPFG